MRKHLKNSISPNPEPSPTNESNFCVVPHGDGWAVARDGKSEPISTHATQATAEEAAKNLIRVSGGRLRVLSTSGRWRESYTIGQNGFAKISAVEGIRFSDEDEKFFADLDDKNITTKQRLEKIIARYTSRNQ